MGSALIIGAGESGPSLVSYVLSSRPVVFIGLISYSLYLWHWPVIVLHDMGAFFRVGLAVPHEYVRLISERHFDLALEISLSFVLGILSWRFVERPFRSGSLRMSGRPLFAVTGAVMAVFIGFATWAISAEGFPRRFSVSPVRMASSYSEKDIYKSLRGGTCFITTTERFEDFNRDLCLYQKDGVDNYLLLGDSHSAALWRALSSSFPGANFMQASTGPCAPLVHPYGSLDCRKMMTYIFQDYLPSHPVHGLFLECRWYGRDIDGITETIEWARQHRIAVVLFGPVQEYDTPLPRLLAYSIAWNLPELAAQHRVSENGLLDARLASLAANTWHIPYVSLYKATCNDGDCTEYADVAHTVPLMFDADHLSQAGSLLIVRRLIERGELH